MKNQKLLDTFAKPACKNCNEELFVYVIPTGFTKDANYTGVKLYCLNGKCCKYYYSPRWWDINKRI